MHQSDAELMRQVQQGDRAAFEALHARFEAGLRLHLSRYVSPEDAEDLVQDAMLRLWDRAGQWDGSGAPLAWLLRAATNLALNHLRDAKRHIAASLVDDDDEDGIPTSALEALEPPTSEQVEWRDGAARLAELMSRAPADKRELLRMARLEGMRMREIAQRLDMPEGTVKSRLHSATQWLADRWEDDQ